MISRSLRLYYLVKPCIPRRAQLALRSIHIRSIAGRHRESWPIDPASGSPPPGWPGWPEGKRFAFVLTHDVETVRGRDRALRLAEMERELGYRSSFNFVPGDYPVSPSLREELAARGFEVGVHGFTHCGKLYSSRSTFEKHAREINRVLREWGATGFRSPSMHRNLEWIHDLAIEYDLSTFDTDPFEPQSEGVRTIFPFLHASAETGGTYAEMPYTLVQDFTLFVLMREKDDSIWRKKLDWIVERGGMALLNVHPDYMAFPGTPRRFDEFDADLFFGFLSKTRARYGGTFWNPLPRDLARFCLKACPCGRKG